MGRTTLQCKHPATLAIYNHLKQNGYADSWDVGYPILNYRYRDNSKPKVKQEGQNDGNIQCEEIWEKSLYILDDLGEKSHNTKNLETREEYNKKYQELRRIIETQTNRPVPWGLEAPYVGIFNKEQREQLEAIQRRIRKAIEHLETLLDPIKKRNKVKHQHCLIACLYWFVLVNESGKGAPHKLVSFLEKQGLSKENIDKIKGEFSKYLQESGGGLGLDDVRVDAKLEATALETVLEKRGLCTEQSKVMYAVLRMAGIKAFFVEPKISVEYAKAKDIQPNPPLPSHMATGIGIKIFDENNVEQVWIIDLALGLLEADYIEDDKDSRWKAHPYWILSLRHFWMVDLSNLGVDQQNKRKFRKTQDSFELALSLGKDSTAYYAMGNYPDLIQRRAKSFTPRSAAFRKAKSLINSSTSIYPYSAKTLFDKGWYLAQEYKWQEAFTAFLQSIKVDPRFGEAYHNAAVSLYGLRLDKESRFYEAWNLFKGEMHKLLKNHSPLREEIKDRLQKMDQSLLLLNDSHAKELIKLINSLYDMLFPR